jgi:hypothetical protein
MPLRDVLRNGLLAVPFGLSRFAACEREIDSAP